MPSVINSDNGSVSGSAGLKFTSADDGVLQIQNNGNTAMTVSAAGVTTFTQPPLTAIPLFSVRKTSNQTLTDQAWTRASFDTVDLDTNSWWDASNHRYVPQIQGYYQFNWQAFVGGTTVTQYYQSLWKNNAATRSERMIGISANTGTGFGGMCSHMLYMNGTTDYVEVYAWIDAASGWQIGSGSTFQGFLVRAT